MKRLITAVAVITLFAVGSAFAVETAHAYDKKSHKSKRERPSFDRCDKDKDGELSISEFAACYPRLGQERFKDVDANNDGKVSKEEMKAFGEKRKGERRRAFFDKCDTNGDGMLSFDEFNACRPEPKGKRGKK